LHGDLIQEDRDDEADVRIQCWQVCFEVLKRGVVFQRGVFSQVL